eukprot:6478043-Amphidinium_carterae.2
MHLASTATSRHMVQSQLTLAVEHGVSMGHIPTKMHEFSFPYLSIPFSAVLVDGATMTLTCGVGPAPMRMFSAERSCMNELTIGTKHRLPYLFQSTTPCFRPFEADLCNSISNTKLLEKWVLVLTNDILNPKINATYCSKPQAIASVKTETLQKRED